VADVLIDACGAVLGVAGFYAAGGLTRLYSARAFMQQRPLV
jgi:hypothetical protein